MSSFFFISQCSKNHTELSSKYDFNFREESIALSILRLVELEKAVVEGAGAVGLAAVIENLLPELKGKK